MISIIIPVWNNLEYTKQCLESIWDTGEKKEEREIIIVDNGSTDGTAGFLAGLSPVVRVFTNPINKGFPLACNQGMGLSNGDKICLLNNDVIVTPGWERILTEHLDNFDIVGPMSNYVAGAQLTRVKEYTDFKSLCEVAEDFRRPRTGRGRAVRWVIGFCMMMKREVYLKTGYFDEVTFGMGNSEDIDFCYRARKEGFKIGIAEDCYVHHFGNITCRNLSVDYAELLQENHLKLIEKWGFKDKAEAMKELGQEIEE